MELLVTELQKGRKELLEIFRTYGGGSAIKPSGFEKRFDKSMVEEILSTGRCEFLEAVDKTGTRLMKSWHTRSTGHKNWDYSDLQSQSSPRIQQFYGDLYRAWTRLQAQNQRNSSGAPEMVTIQDAAVDVNYGKGLAAIQKKLNKAKNDLLKAIKSDSTMYEKVKEQYEEVKGGKTPPQKITDNYKALCAQLSAQHVAYVDEKSKKIVKDVSDLSDALFWGGYSGYLTGGIETEILLFVFPMVGFMTDAALAAAMTPLGVGIGLFALLGLASLALFVANETGITKRLGKITAKRYEIKVNEKMTAVLKCMNEASRYAETYMRKFSEKSASEGVTLDDVPDEIKKVVATFVTNQHNLWAHYLSAEGKGYDSDLIDDYGRHYSGLVKKQSTAQKSEIGSYKLAIANIWHNMKCDF